MAECELKECIYYNSDKSCFGDCETYPAISNELKKVSKLNRGGEKNG